MPKIQYFKLNSHKGILLGISLFSGILMGLAPAPVSAWPLAWVALIPLWILIVKKAEFSSKPFLFNFIFLVGLAWGIGYHGLALSWITGVHPMTWMGVPWLASLAIALFCWIAITLWGAILVALWSAGMVIMLSQIKKGKLKNKTFPISLLPYLRVLLGVALWCSLEAFWSLGPLWWTSLAYTQSPHNLAILHLAQLSGPSIVTAAIVAVNGFLAEAWIGLKSKNAKFNIKEFSQALIFPVSFLIALHLIGFGLYNYPLEQPPETALKVGIIQGNIPNELKLYPAGWRRALQGYTTGYETLADQGVEAVLTPEVALPYLWNSSDRLDSSFNSAVQKKGVVAWVGALGEQGRSITNSLFTLTRQSEIFSRYNKVKLVPLGEYIPFEQFLGSFIDRLSPLDAHMVAGKADQLFDTPFGRAIVGICYESAFSEHFRRQAAAGGQFILTSSNNAHYSTTMPAQHHAQDVMRAIETDRWAVRATNTGYSGIVNPHGRTLWISGINSYATHADTVYRRQTRTLYVSWGDWFTPVLLVGGVIAWFLGRRNSAHLDD